MYTLNFKNKNLEDPWPPWVALSLPSKNKIFFPQKSWQIPIFFQNKKYVVHIKKTIYNFFFFVDVHTNLLP